MDGNFKYWMGIWEPAISVICHKGAAPCLFKKKHQRNMLREAPLYTFSHIYIFYSKEVQAYYL